MSLELQDLQDVTAICRAGSFRKAAEVLGVTQPTLSARVQRIEKRLGAMLFERARGHSSPTRMALLIAEQADSLLEDAQRLMRDVEHAASGGGGTITIACGPAPAACLLDRVVMAANQALPKLTLSCRTGSVKELMDLLDASQADIVISALDPGLARPHFEFESIIRDEIILAMHPQHPARNQPPQTVKEIFRHRVAMPELEPRYLNLARLEYGLDLNQIPGVVYSSNFALLEQLAATGDYLVLGPSLTFSRSVLSDRLVQCPFPGGLSHDIYLFSNKNTRSLPAGKIIMDIVRQVAAELGKPRRE